MIRHTCASGSHTCVHVCLVTWFKLDLQFAHRVVVSEEAQLSVQGVQSNNGFQAGERLTCRHGEGQSYCVGHRCVDSATIRCAVVLTIRLGGDPPLGVGGEAFAQPHLLPGGVGDGIAKPAMCDLVDDVDQQELTALQDGGDDEGETGVLHRDNGEGRGEEDDVTPEDGGMGGLSAVAHPGRFK